MNFPQQPKDIDAERQALAPYNFVPLPEQVVTLPLSELPDGDRYGEMPGRLSGYLECDLTTASPFYIRAGRTPDQYQKRGKEAPVAFFHLEDGLPVIPGSSLRGMLRSVIEVVSYGKVQSVTDAPLVYRAVGDTTSHGEHYRNRLMRYDGEQDRSKLYTPLILGGYMVRLGAYDWAIRPAKTIGGTTYAHVNQKKFSTNGLKRLKGCRNAYKIYVQTGPFDYQKVRGGFLRIKYARVMDCVAAAQPGYRPATLATSGWMNSKRTEAVIYEPDPQAKLLKVSDEQIDAYRAQISQEQQKLLGDDGVLNDGQPVFYVLDDNGEVFFFGHCRMFRIPYPHSPQEYVPAQLRRERDLDLAEAIFGYTKSDQMPEGAARAYAGRVFVSDARLTAEAQTDDLWLAPEKTIKPRIMGSPKPTTFQHYLVQTQPNAKQVGRTRDGKPKYKVYLDDYAAKTPEEAVIRGHKFYWHKGEAELSQIAEDPHVLEELARKQKEDTQHTQIQPLRPGVKFHFRIGFENLAPKELGALLWVLEVAGREDYRLKLGMGKPLGMGAVAIRADLHLIDRRARYRILLDENGWAEGLAANEISWQNAVAAFESTILAALDRSSLQTLARLERIQALLALLRWPGPDPAKTRYLEIEYRGPDGKGRKVNEYRDRPVLPTPFGVWGPQLSNRATAPPDVGSPKPDKDEVIIPPGYQKGTVKDFGLGKKASYGFIYPASGGGEVFVHISDLAPGVQTLSAGQEVMYKLETSQRGPQAKDVRPI